MRKTAFLIFLAMIVVFAASSSYAQFFGKNKVQYVDFKWQYLQSEHFDIYFTEGGKGVASFVAKVGEDSYQSLHKDFRYDLEERIKIIVYNSHNDFGQTNVDLSPPEESVGGFTEFFKNRVVIPYEGEWEKFRHVIHHELTHAVMMQMVYGAGPQSIIRGLTQIQLPLWFVEGLAEYESLGWNIESDMFMRDATLNGYLPPIPFLGGFLAYKGGQSVLYYIAERYGDEKIGELLGKTKINKSLDRGLKKAIGIDTEELTTRWHRYLKRKYWPDIADRKEPEEIAKRLTDHRKDKSFINTSPAMSNRGDKIAFLSDKDDYFDIYLASAIDGRILKKLVRGQRAGNLEELHWLRGPGISWSPDDKHIVFSAKSGGKDALHIVNVKSGKFEESINLKLDGVYNPTWSPNGDEVAFAGLKNGQSDLFAYNLKTKQLRKITNDLFSDVEPRWSPDGGKLVFSSDRGPYTNSIPTNFQPIDVDMKNYDIYEINSDGTDLKRITGSEYLERTPIYSPDGKTIAFMSNRSGISNIYLHNLETGKEWPITNVLTGAFQPTWGGNANRMAFASFYYAGYDLYLMKNPLEIKPDEITVQETQFVKSKKEPEYAGKELVADESGRQENQPVDNETKKYRNFIFDESFADGRIKKANEKNPFLDSTDYVLPTGEYKVHKYKVKFSPDLVYGTVGYNQFFGTQGYTTIMLSDVLGDQRLNIGLNLFGDFRNADYSLTYLYLPHRLDFGASGYHNAYYFYSSAGWVRDRNYGLSMFLSNPFNRYQRISYGLSLMGISRSYLEISDELVDLLVKYDIVSPRNLFFLLNNLTYSKDTTVWGYTGPVNGGRSSIGISATPAIGKNGISFTTFRGDFRRYFRIKKEYVFAVRGAGGASFGKHPAKFFLGGESNWINYGYRGNIRADRVEDIYFASFEMPLRGAAYYELVGTRYLMTNVEFRFPLVRQLSMGFPLPIQLWNVGGAMFMDMAMAWDRTGDKSLKPFVKRNAFSYRANDIFASIGFGARINLGFFLLRMDLAWKTDFYKTEKSPAVLWSLGADF